MTQPLTKLLIIKLFQIFFSSKIKCELNRRTINDIIKNRIGILNKSNSFKQNIKSAYNSLYKELKRRLDVMTTNGVIENDYFSLIMHFQSLKIVILKLPEDLLINWLHYIGGLK